MSGLAVHAAKSTIIIANAMGSQNVAMGPTMYKLLARKYFSFGGGRSMGSMGPVECYWGC